MKRVLWAAMLVLLTFSMAEAVPIEVSAGQSVIFNFDLTGADPPPPYSWEIRVDTRVDLPSLSDAEAETARWDVFILLDAQGPLIATTGPGVDDLVFAGGWFQGVLDGVFSLRLTMLEGSVILDPCAVGVDGLGSEPTTPCIPATVAATPEPATLALLGAGLLAAAIRRRIGR